MHQILAANGVEVVKQLMTTDLDEIKDFISARLNNTYPLVLKPVDSSGTNGVHVCFNEDDVVKAHYEILNIDNVFGYKNTNLIVQEFMSGNE